MDWRTIFKKDVKEKLVQAKKEFDTYKSTSQILYLQQAGNKLFSAVENWLMLKYGKRAYSYENIRKMVADNQYDKDLLLEANHLHKFYYNSFMYIDNIDAEEYFNRVYDKMKNRVK